MKIREDDFIDVPDAENIILDIAMGNCLSMDWKFSYSI